jgi:(R,R)-butanediol dehydrogenase / meso-butanediol dehydrogenase / diacetyl reductase
VKAARWFGRGDVRVVDVPEPSAGPGQALLRIGSCGICGTDVEEYRHGPVLIPTDRPHPLTGRFAPLTLGHEFWGTVVEVGPHVTNLREGDRVAPEICLACGTCPYCRGGEPARCVSWAALGLHADGGLAEYVAVSAASCARLPESMADAHAALVEPTEVAVRAVRRSGLRLGERAAVIGGGAIGLLVLQAARAAGARNVYVVEPGPKRREVATAIGADDAIDPTDPGWRDRLAEHCDGLGPDVVFECSGAPGTANAAVASARKGGRIVLVGITKEPAPMPLMDIVVGEKQVLGSIQHDSDHDLPAAVHLLASGQVSARHLVTARIQLDRVVEDGFNALSPGGDHIKILVESSFTA